MQSNWTKTENAKGILEVVVEGGEWEKAQKKVLNQLKNTMNVNGFRKGKIPAAMIKRMIPLAQRLEAAAEEVANKALAEAVKEHDIELIASPELEIAEASPEKAVLKFTCDITPDVILGQYKDLPAERAEVTVTEEDVDAKVAEVQERYADWVLVEDEPAKEGDQVVIDFVGTLDGVPFDGGSADGVTIVLGSHQMIPGFEEGIVGMKSGDVKDVDVTFPENYPAQELAGKPAVFAITLHDIKAKELPEANDELIEMMDHGAYSTMDEFRSHMKDVLLEEKNKAADEAYENAIIDELLQNNSVDIPRIMIDNEIDQKIKQQNNQLRQAGFTLEQAMAAQGMTLEELRAAIEPSAVRSLKTSLILAALAKAENLIVTDEEVQDELTELSELYQMPVEKIARLIPEDSIRDNLEFKKAFDFVKEHTAKSE